MFCFTGGGRSWKRRSIEDLNHLILQLNELLTDYVLLFSFLICDYHMHMHACNAMFNKFMNKEIF